jgi:hypothetical protein
MRHLLEHLKTVPYVTQFFYNYLLLEALLVDQLVK